MTTYRQTSMNLTPATEAQLDYLKAKGFGGTTDIVRIAIDRMATQEGMNTMEYTAWVSNDQGASTDVADGVTFASKRAAADAARSEFGKGWRVHIIDNFNQEVETFRISK